MSGEMMQAENEKYIENISNYMLVHTNMTEEQAWSFAFR